jgi:hypothetical protein
MVRTMFHQRLINIVVSNVGGPPIPVYFARARLCEVFQLSVLQGNLGLAVGVLSYAGGLNLDIAADVDTVPDVEVFAAGISDALKRLGTANRPRIPDDARVGLARDGLDEQGGDGALKYKCLLPTSALGLARRTSWTASSSDVSCQRQRQPPSESRWSGSASKLHRGG